MVGSASGVYAAPAEGRENRLKELTLRRSHGLIDRPVRLYGGVDDAAASTSSTDATPRPNPSM